MDKHFSVENDARKQNLDDVNEWIGVENAKRQKEAEELRERMEREKRELQEFIDKDNKKMADKIQSENEERLRKEEEMKNRLKDAQEVMHHTNIDGVMITMACFRQAKMEQFNSTRKWQQRMQQGKWNPSI